MEKLVFFSIITGLFFLGAGCSSTQSLNKINLFSPSDDITLGKQVGQEIRSNPSQFPILPEKGNEEVYRYIRVSHH